MIPEDIKSELNIAAWQHKHILDVDNFSIPELELVMTTTDVMKEILARPMKKVPTLRGKTVVTLFYEPSTRTRSSFELAAKNLSADTINMTTSASSVTKGESLIDTLHTLEAIGADIIIMRHLLAGAPYLAAQYSKASIVNGGDGAHAHPTQALLDLYTIRSHKKLINGLKAVIVGDIKHSRVAHSNIWTMTKMGIDVTLSGPYTLLPSGLNDMRGIFPHVTVEPDLDKALIGADIVMALRLQKERQSSGLLPSVREYVKCYQITEERLKASKKDVMIMHPGPVNEDIEIARNVAYGEHSVITEQVANGVAVRMAVLYLVSGRQEL